MTLDRQAGEQVRPHGYDLGSHQLPGLPVRRPVGDERVSAARETHPRCRRGQGTGRVDALATLRQTGLKRDSYAICYEHERMWRGRIAGAANHDTGLRPGSERVEA